MSHIVNRSVVFFLGYMPKPIVRRFADRYIAGDTLDEAVELVRDLNRQHIMATFDVLGEEIYKLEEGRHAVDEYKRCLEAIHHHSLDANISLKPTQFGLGINLEVAEANIREVVAVASALNIFVRIDMEDSRYTSATFEMYLRLKKQFPNVGTVMQAYMRRSHDDLLRMLPEGINLRLCKGIYDEARRIAHKDSQIINENYTLLLEEMLKAGAYAGIATHDEKLVWQGMRLVKQYQLERHQYEFQMLLGVDKELREIIVNQGHRLRLYVPYGTQWYPYSMRRMRENPQIAMHIISNLFKPG